MIPILEAIVPLSSSIGLLYVAARHLAQACVRFYALLTECFAVDLAALKAEFWRFDEKAPQYP